MSSTVQQKQQQQQAKLQQLQSQMAAIQQASQKCVQQYHENDMVLKELEDAGEDAKIYKMIGRALVPQEYVEATSTVSKRLEFIRKEEERLERSMKELQEKAREVVQG